MTSWIVSEDVLRNPSMRPACLDDVPRIVELLQTLRETDPVEDTRTPPADAYVAAFKTIDADPNNALMALDAGGHIVATLQFTLVPNLSHVGRPVAIVENVVVDPRLRGRGLGGIMMRWAIAEAKRRGCYRISLTSNNARTDAHRFYERLGFERTHAGLRIVFDGD